MNWSTTKKIYLFLDGRCDDLYNYEECLYDYGDCCRPIIQGECDNCICHEDGKVKMKLGIIQASRGLMLRQRVFFYITGILRRWDQNSGFLKENS